MIRVWASSVYVFIQVVLNTCPHSDTHSTHLLVWQTAWPRRLHHCCFFLNYDTAFDFVWARAFLKWQRLLSRDRRAKAPEMATWCWFWWAHHSRPCSLCSLCWCLQHFKMRLWQILLKQQTCSWPELAACFTRMQQYWNRCKRSHMLLTTSGSLSGQARQALLDQLNL